MSKAKKVMLMAGGTGGHIYPALACAERFADLGVDVEWIGSAGGMEERIVREHDILLHTLSIKGVRGKGTLGLVLAPWRIAHSIGQAIAVMRKAKPDLVLGMGGFVAGPGGVAAKLLGIPVVVHEQNAVSGTTNRLLSNIAKLKLQAFDGALQNGMTVGNPVRNSILQQIARQPREQGARPLRLLVLGGSLGAKAINDIVPDLLMNWKGENRLDVWHQTGARNIETVEERYRALGVEARVDAYIDNMNQAYYWADIVLCRAGAMTVSELAIAGLPSILVPFPFAIDDHQTKNALALQKVGGAFLIPQKDLTVEGLSKVLMACVTEQDKLKEMARRAKEVARPDATQTVVAQCIRLMKND
ncbi:undecaprenyldiphospho-muramoylpentapeptide beta-N-acetylglucosaminyltransferase [Marinomonas piezotolerans]|uniref:UDP-N-acetylglucosamine--N-acetylmuramyl-(pentapeptide) pyrophosphoryl-undecaprenol N-acetylglucosamine transferase n=1 Tax=Marinomonas piezotolerans TaxID=2213058 RepID=A0A370U5A4_9GAMM|nr:undecaprenyldiphospho-muramoylpentapeptide beta-N-acetylglucosaminyltransferase [Marinomonas piezotolerans]RDL42964.1 undecaprenyldiphospho-muramoylpentapeptide beta-N-acetylglucosaminyltransferase [Marinomonas piezotolerans]